jgi:hypothetical protein
MMRAWTAMPASNTLRNLRPEYLAASKPEKTRLLDEAERRTGWNRKVLIRKFHQPTRLVDRPRRKRPARYDLTVKDGGRRVVGRFRFPLRAAPGPVVARAGPAPVRTRTPAL